jgi:hypothetical protein
MMALPQSGPLQSAANACFDDLFEIMPVPGCCSSGVASRPCLPREATAIAPIARRFAKAAGFDEVPAPKDYKMLMLSAIQATPRGSPLSVMYFGVHHDLFFAASRRAWLDVDGNIVMCCREYRAQGRFGNHEVSLVWLLDLSS